MVFDCTIAILSVRVAVELASRTPSIIDANILIARFIHPLLERLDRPGIAQARFAQTLSHDPGWCGRNDVFPFLGGA